MKTYQTIIINLIVIFLIVAVPLIVISKDNPEKQGVKFVYAGIGYSILLALTSGVLLLKYNMYVALYAGFFLIGGIIGIVKAFSD